VKIPSVSPEEAADLLSASRGHVYLDVRSVEEFTAGHPRSAYNIPLLLAEPGTGRLVSNPEFLGVVQATFQPDTSLLVGCLAGGRSLKAAEILKEAGYSNVWNVRCGFGGARNFLGHVVEPGWSALGLPVDRGGEPGKSYESLLHRARS